MVPDVRKNMTGRCVDIGGIKSCGKQHHFGMEERYRDFVAFNSFRKFFHERAFGTHE
jgi:hypothetical protein